MITPNATTPEEAVDYVVGLEPGTKQVVQLRMGYTAMFYHAVQKYITDYKRVHKRVPLKMMNMDYPGRYSIEIFERLPLEKPSTGKAVSEEIKAIAEMGERIEFDFTTERLVTLRSQVYARYPRQMSVRVSGGKIIVERKVEGQKSLRERVTEAIRNGVPSFIVQCDPGMVQSIRTHVSSNVSRGDYRVSQIEGGCLIYSLEKVRAQAVAL